MIIYIKSKEEIEGFKEAGKIAGTILNILMEKVEAGVKTNDLDELAREECKKHNVIPTFLNYQGFPSAICSSVNKTLVHGIPNNIPLVHGDIVSIDFGVTLDGFIGDTARTKVISSEYFEEQETLNISCKRSLEKSISMAKPGNKLSDISSATYSSRGKYSVPAEFGGHGIGRNELHADPFIPNFPDYEDDFILREGMVLAIEPMFINGHSKLSVAENKWDIVAEGLTAHYEHTILITDKEPYILTKEH